MEIVEINGLSEPVELMAIDQTAIKGIMQPWIDGKTIDQEMAESTPCPKCGAGMTFDPRYEYVGEGEKPEYHAWAICDGEPECGYEFEF